jgi:hypothetical protein
LTDFFIFIRNHFIKLTSCNYIKKNSMKKLILLIPFYFLLSSCEFNSGQPEASLETLTVSEVDMPTAYAKDSITEIPIRYIRPTSCHSFYNFYYDKNNFDRTVAIYSLRSNLTNCVTDNVTVVDVVLRFKPTEIGTYYFKFWSGEDAGGLDQFIEYEAVVDH